MWRVEQQNGSFLSPTPSSIKYREVGYMLLSRRPQKPEPVNTNWMYVTTNRHDNYQSNRSYYNRCHCWQEWYQEIVDVEEGLVCDSSSPTKQYGDLSPCCFQRHCSSLLAVMSIFPLSCLNQQTVFIRVSWFSGHVSASQAYFRSLSRRLQCRFSKMLMTTSNCKILLSFWINMMKIYLSACPKRTTVYITYYPQLAWENVSIHSVYQILVPVSTKKSFVVCTLYKFI